jgi:putative flippase GtrA
MTAWDPAHELGAALRFGVVGVLATALHMGMVWWLIGAGISPLPANLLAFLSAFLVSFVGHYHWSFRSTAHPLRAMLRFLTVAVGLLAVNSLLLSWLLQLGWPERTAAVAAAMSVPVLGFLASRFWAFRAPAPGTG